MRKILAVLLLGCAIGVSAQASDVPQEQKTTEQVSGDYSKQLEGLNEQLAELKSKIDKVNASVSDPKGALETAKSDISKLKKITFSGYVQSRFQTANYDKDLSEIEGSTYDTFIVRRARLKATAKAGERSGAVLQIDLGRNAVTVKDAYLTYAFEGNADTGSSLQFGQQNWWFGYEVPYSSSKRETPERALFARRFFPGERDQGLVFFGPTKSKLAWIAGLYNGTGTEKNNAADLNDQKDLLVRLQYHGSGYDCGVSGYSGEGVWKTFGDAVTYMKNTEKVRYGADVQWYGNPVTIKAEYQRAKGMDQAAADFDQNNWLDGWLAQFNYSLSAKDLFVTRYSTLSQDPSAPALGRINAWEFGLLRWLDTNTRIKLFYKKNTSANAAPAGTVDDVITTEIVVTF